MSQALKASLSRDGGLIKTLGVFGLPWMSELGVMKCIRSWKTLPQIITILCMLTNVSGEVNSGPLTGRTHLAFNPGPASTKKKF